MDSAHRMQDRAQSLAHPSTFLTWLRYAENAIKIFGSAYGLEHVQERMKFLQALREAHEEDENAFPFTYCTQLFEEMTAVWCEEVREKRRGLCAKTRDREPLLGGFEAPGIGPRNQRAAKFSSSHVSGTWPIRPAIIRRLSFLAKTKPWHGCSTSSFMSMLPENASQTIEKQLGPPRQRVQVFHPMSQIKPAGRPAWHLRPKSLRQERAPKPIRRENIISPAEVKRAHAPQCQKTKKPICWDAACHIGCQRSSCPHAHEPLPSLSRLDYTVAMQVLRRGGLKNGPKVNPKDVDGRVAQLRAQAKEEQASKIEPARGKTKAKAKAKEKAGWSVPEDYQRPVTGPGDRTGGPRSRTGSRLASKFCQRYHALFHPRGRRRGGSGVLRPLDGCSDRLHSHAAARLVNHAVNGTQTDLSAILAQAVDYGHPQLAEEAQTYLESLGGKVEAQFEQMTWDGKTGRTRLLFHEPLGRCSTPARY